MRKALAVLALLLVPFPLSADAAPKKRAKIVEGIVATVGERCIMLSDVRKRVGAVPEAQRGAALAAELEKMIDEQIVAIDIERTKLTVDSREIDERIAAEAKKNGMTEGQFLDSLEKRGVKRTEYREATVKAVAAEKWESRVVRPKLKPGEDPAAGRARIVRELRASYDVEVLL
jgi:predicted transcriptional regulator